VDWKERGVRREGKDVRIRRTEACPKEDFADHCVVFIGRVRYQGIG
jgi:hypothetical protein